MCRQPILRQGDFRRIARHTKERMHDIKRERKRSQPSRKRNSAHRVPQARNGQRYRCIRYYRILTCQAQPTSKQRRYRNAIRNFQGNGFFGIRTKPCTGPEKTYPAQPTLCIEIVFPVFRVFRHAKDPSTICHKDCIQNGNNCPPPLPLFLQTTLNMGLTMQKTNRTRTYHNRPRAGKHRGFKPSKSHFADIIPSTFARPPNSAPAKPAAMPRSTIASQYAKFQNA